MRCGRAKAMPDAIIAKRGLKQMSDTGELEKIVDEVLAANAQQVEEYKGRQGEGVQLAGRPGDEGDRARPTRRRSTRFSSASWRSSARHSAVNKKRGPGQGRVLSHDAGDYFFAGAAGAGAGAAGWPPPLSSVKRALRSA